jgi:hypothetical protein
MAHVRFWNEGRDLLAEYLYLKSHRPAQARAIRDAITVIHADPDRAERMYSVPIDPENGWLAMPFLGPDGLTCLVWRQSPHGYDEFWIGDFDQPWGDLALPRDRPSP